MTTTTTTRKLTTRQLDQLRNRVNHAQLWIATSKTRLFEAFTELDARPGSCSQAMVDLAQLDHDAACDEFNGALDALVAGATTGQVL